ncbi:MAG TPA: twin-arginine translocase TatA/TatE family subunit [Woeseiaceae bacterium]|nr:twin-arginine translocase TatA/TatE family subunit [Woeseiaceae bacterium]
MSGIAPSEFLLICLIGLMILGPERLPVVARKIGSWMGKARQMTRSLQRQLEEETSVKKNFGFDPKDLDPNELIKPRDDDTYSPLHDEEDDDDDAPEKTGEEKPDQ